MSPRRVWPTAGLRALGAVALALSVATCRDALGPRGTGAGQGHVVFAPVLPSEAALASFGLAIDQVRIIVVRPAADTLADTTVALLPDSSGIDLDIHVALLSSPETLSVSIIALSGAIPLFQGTSDVEVTSGSDTPTPAEIPVDNYVGPGAGVDSIEIQPAAPFIYLNDSLRFQVQAWDADTSVEQFYVAWSTSDSTIATVNGFGVLRAPATRGSVRVRARTPGGVADSVTAVFVPLPTQLVLIAGAPQSGPAGQALATPLEVEVRAADNLPVGGVGVRFQASGGGGPADDTVTTDVLGRAQVVGVLGPVAGAQSFQASVPGFPAIPAVAFNLTAVAGPISAATSIVTASAGSVASGTGVTLRLQGKDAAGNSVTTGGATVAFNFAGGTSTGTIGATADSGNGVYTATFTGVVSGTATTVRATIDGDSVTTPLPTVAVTPGTISAATSVLTAASGSVASGSLITLTLRGKDAAGNNVTNGGAAVVFSFTGGTSTGTIGATADSGTGVYTATFTGVLAGTPTTIGATIGGSLVTTTLPTVAVVAGGISTVTSIVTVSSDSIASGVTATLRLRAKDAAGNDLTLGGAVVAFSFAGGVSTGTIGATTDSADGVYTATFTGVIAGAPTTIGATINGGTVTSALPTIAVTPGVISAATSVVTTSSGTVASGALATLTLQAKDAAGNALTTGGAAVAFSAAGGTSTGTIGATTDLGNGTYTATFTGLGAGTPTTIGATINAVATASTTAISVVPGNTAAAQSTITVSNDTVVSGAGVTLTLQARDSAGNPVPTGGSTVVFGHSGGLSTGTIAPSPATDNGNGTYTATFTGVMAGTATTIGGTLDGATVTSTLPTVAVTPGPVSAATSVVTVSSATVASGVGVTLTLQAKDAAGNALSTGGATVAFGFSGGTSTGTIGATTDSGNGTYTASFTGVTAGTATTIGATVNATPVSTTLPTIAVTPGATATVVVTPVLDTIHALALTRQFAAEARDANGNLVGDTFTWSSSALAVATVDGTGLAAAAGNGTATITATSNTSSVFGTATLTVAQLVTAVQVVPPADTIHALGNSRVFAAVAKDANDSVVAGQPFTWSSSDTLIAKVDALGVALAIGNGTATITATAAGVPGTATLLVQQVVASVVITPDTGSVQSPGLTLQFAAQALDSNTVAVIGKTFTWASTNPLIATVDAAGLATGVATGVDTITATADGVTGIALFTVFNATHAADIIADETWTAAASPHIVTDTLKIRNGATLTIEDGATVKFDSGGGLQIGDTLLGEAGNLVMLGTPGSIHLTANTVSPVPGFWRGLEIQKTSGPLTWRNVDIEYAGGSRSNPFNEACILLVDPTASVELDSVHIRQCVHAGVHHFAGTLHMHRSEIDSVTGSGIHAEHVTGAPVLRLDSTTIRGSGEEGLFIANNLGAFVDLVGATGNRFIGNAVAGVHMAAIHLPGFGPQDSIAGNGTGGVGDSILVDSGTVGYGVPSFTIFRQPAPYRFTGSLNVWSDAGVNLTLDSGVVMTFDTLSYMSVGDFADSAGNSSGVSANLASLGTATSPVVIRNRLGHPGWGGLYLGAQSGTPVLRHIRFVHGGYQPTCSTCPPVLVQGFFEPLNANLWVDAPLGTAPLAIDSVVSDSSHFHGIVVKRQPPPGMRVRDNVITNSAGTGLVLRARQYNPADTIGGNTITGNFYALDLPATVLPGLGANTLTRNGRDTLLLHGGTLVVSDTLPQLGFRWRVTQSMGVDAGAEFTVLAGDTLVFDLNTTLTIGGAAPSALNAMGTAGSPVVFTASSGLFWGGLEFANVSAAGGASVSNLIIEHAGTALPCQGDCLPIVFAALRYKNVSANALTLDAITVRQSTLLALDVDSSSASPLTVQGSQFYQNAFSPMIRSPSPTRLSIHGSDLYHYNGQIIQTATGGPDSLDAIDNWWGDAAALYAGFPGDDSLGRAALDSGAVRFNVLSGPLFPVGPAAQLVPATDTILTTAAINATVGDPDSIRARVLDAEGRGVAGTTIGWGTSSGAFQFLDPVSDVGGRAGGVWVTDSIANDQFVQATVAGLVGSPVTWTAFLAPAPTQSVNFQLLFERAPGDTVTRGLVSADSNSVTFTSSGRQGVLVTNARDVYGNVTHPTSVPDFCYDDPAATGFCHNQFWYLPQYGIIDSVKADSVFFTVTTATTPLFQIRAQYEGGAFVDSILINVAPVAAGMRINADTADYNSLCPVGGPYNVACRRTFIAQLVDSAGTPLPPDTAFQFSWTNPNPGTVSDSTYGPMNEFADLTAHANGTDTIIVQQASGPVLVPDRDTLPIAVNQVLANIAVTPDTVSAGLGDTVTFSATATDQGGSPMPGAVGWRQDAPAGQYLTIIDFPSANSIRVRIDSAYPSFPRDLAAITAFTERAPGDTLLAAGVIYNPIIQTLGGFSSQPWAVAIDPVTNRAYVGNRGSANVAIVDATTNTIVRFQDVEVQPEHVTVDSKNALVYASNLGSGTVSVLDGANDGVLLATIPVGPNPTFVAVDTASNVAYVAAVCSNPPVCDRGGPYLLKIDGAGRAFVPGDTVPLPANGTGVAFDDVTRLVYVSMANDTVAIVDPSSNTVIGLIGVGSVPKGMAINPVTRKLYVTNSNASSVSVIDLATNSVVKTESVFSNAPERVAVDPIINRIYVVGYGNFLIDQIDGSTDTNIGYRSVNCTYPNDVAVNAQNRDLFMPCWSDTLLLTYRFLTLP